MKKEKPVASTSSAPSSVLEDSESKDPLEGVSANRPPSVRGSKTPKQEPEMEAMSSEEKESEHTGTLTPKPEVCILWCSVTYLDICACVSMSQTMYLSDNMPFFISAGTVCQLAGQPLLPS